MNHDALVYLVSGPEHRQWEAIRSHRVGPRNPGGTEPMVWLARVDSKTVDRPMVCSVDIRTCFVLLRGLLVDERS